MVTDKLITLLKTFEGLHDGDKSKTGLQPQLCPANLWTVGYGRVLTYKGRQLKGEADRELALKVNMVHTEADAEKALMEDVSVFYANVKTITKDLGITLNQDQLEALTSFAYNVGVHAFRTSTLLKRIKANASLREIEIQFNRWVYSNGKPLRGLANRRKTEFHLYATGLIKFFR